VGGAGSEAFRTSAVVGGQGGAGPGAGPGLGMGMGVIVHLSLS
jgi:hypothetical protein